MSTARWLRRSVYSILFLFGVQYGLALYFNSAFLASRGFSEQSIGIIFAAGSVFALVMLFFAPRLFTSLGNLRVFVIGTAAAGVLLVALAGSNSSAVIAVVLPAIIGLPFLLSLSIDMFLETTTSDENRTGVRRGIVVALINGAFMVAQLIAIYLLASGSFPLLYMMSGIALVLISALAAVLLHGFRDAKYERPDWHQVFRRLRDSADMRLTFFVQFLLRLFYATMIVYTPLYLHGTLGMSYEAMGAMFAFMLIPFVLLEVPLGWLEDTRWGESEALAVGLVWTVLVTALLSFVTTPSIALWAAALFATRIGAAMIEISSDAYFFKNVDGTQSGEVSAFRILHPLAYVIGPLAGAAFLLFFPMQYIFLALAICLALGIPAAIRLRDTR